MAPIISSLYPMGIKPLTHWQPSRCEVLGVCQWSCAECPERPHTHGGLDSPQWVLVVLPHVAVRRSEKAILETLPPCYQGSDREGS